MKQKHFLLFLHLILLSSCATIFNGTRQNIPVNTDPPGAVVTEEGNSQSTPTTLTLDKDRKYVLTIIMEGYEPQTVKIERVVNGWMALDILDLDPISLIVDSSDGAAWTLKPDHITVTLRPLTLGEKITEIIRPHSKTVKQELDALKRLKDSNLLTENEYNVLRNLTIHCDQ